MTQIICCFVKFLRATFLCLYSHLTTHHNPTTYYLVFHKDSTVTLHLIQRNTRALFFQY